ncbi:hypothetical protein K2Z84_15410, partial [Candidatus Binatia bacterium]|nr:hypothetical protein [Candidatus Binatia bacterium]
MPASAPARARLLRPPLRGERDYVHVADIVAGIYAAVPAARSALLLRLTAPAACAIEIVPASSGAPPALRCGTGYMPESRPETLQIRSAE